MSATSNAVQQALMALGIRTTLYSLTASEISRVRGYLAHYYPALNGGDDVYLHNDTPLLESFVEWQPISALVFRGSGRSYADIGDGFHPVLDPRFDKAVIIRDSWIERRVMTHMQTKSVLAWSKSFQVALEYAQGCITGSVMDGSARPGWLHFCWVETGLDVVDVVRDWEGSGTLGTAIDPGHQNEVLTPAVGRNKILASWELAKIQGIGQMDFKLASITEHVGNFSAVLPTYRRIADLVQVGQVYDCTRLGMDVDRFILL